MTFAPGALVKVGNFADSVWVVRCQAGRKGWWHLQRKEVGRATYNTRVAREGELRLVRPAPRFKIGEGVSYTGVVATVIEDLGDLVAVAVGLSRLDVPKSDLVLERL